MSIVGDKQPSISIKYLSLSIYIYFVISIVKMFLLVSETKSS